MALPWVFRDIHCVTAAIRTEQGVWVGTGGGGVYRFTNPQRPPIQRFGSVDGLPDDRITTLAGWGSGRIAVGTARGLAAVEALKVVPRPALPPAGAAVSALVADPDGRLWVGWAGGLGRVAGDGAPAVALAAVDVTDLALDVAGDLWVATASDGVLHVAGRFAERFDKPHGLATSGASRLLTTAAGQVLALGTLDEGRDRLSVYDGERWRGYRVVQPDARWQLLDLAVVERRWLGLSNFGVRLLGPRVGPRGEDTARPLVKSVRPPPRPPEPRVAADTGADLPDSPLQEELPPFVRRKAPQDTLLAASEQAAAEAVVAARAAYFRARAARQALQAELKALSVRSEAALERAEALERRLVEAKLSDPDPSQVGLLSTDLDAARVAARDAGVAAELARVRAKRLDADASAHGDAALREQKSYETLVAQIDPQAPAPPTVPPPEDPAPDPLAGLAREELALRVAPYPTPAPVSERSGLSLTARATPPLPEVAPGQATLWRGDDSGSLWVGTRNAGLLRLHAGVVQSFAVGDLVPEGPAQGPLVDGDGSVWVVGPQGDLLRHDGARWHNVPVSAVGARSEEPVGTPCALALDEQRRVVVALEREGTLTFLRRVATGWQKGRTWPLLGTTLPLAVQAFRIDADGGRWLGLALHDAEGEVVHAGLIALDPAEAAARWYGLSAPAGLLRAEVSKGPALPSNTVTALAVDKRRIWAGTTSGLVRIDRTELRVFDENDELESEYVRAVTVGKGGAVWFTAGGSLARLAADGSHEATRLPGGLRPDCLITDQGGAVWAAGQGGLQRWDGSQWVAVPLIGGPLEGPVRHVVFDGDGRSWLLQPERLLVSRPLARGDR